MTRDVRALLAGTAGGLSGLGVAVLLVLALSPVSDYMQAIVSASASLAGWAIGWTWGWRR